MSSDESGRPDREPKRDRQSDGAAERVVLVADSDPAVTDELAGLIDDAVRTAEGPEDVRAALGPEVALALVDPTLFPDGTDPVAVLSGEPDRALVALVGENAGYDDGFDEHLDKPLDPSAVRDTVDRLRRRVTYARTLDRYFTVAQERATLPADHPRREALDDRIAALRADLDDLAEGLDDEAVYRAALQD